MFIVCEFSFGLVVVEYSSLDAQVEAMLVTSDGNYLVATCRQNGKVAYCEAAV